MRLHNSEKNQTKKKSSPGQWPRIMKYHSLIAEIEYFALPAVALPCAVGSAAGVTGKFHTFFREWMEHPFREIRIL